MSRDTTRRRPPLLFLLASLFSTAFTNSAFFFFSLSINQRLCAKPSFVSVPFLLHPTMDSQYTLKSALLLSCFLIILDFSCVPVHALNIGVQAADSSATVSKDCSRKCESEFCSVPPFLRYGKYCGLLYSGCPGEKPCDGLDACCMRHDACVQAKNNDYLSQECSQALLNCMNSYKQSGAPTFKGNTCQAAEVINVVTTVMEAALLAGRYLHRP